MLYAKHWKKQIKYGDSIYLWNEIIDNLQIMRTTCRHTGHTDSSGHTDYSGQTVAGEGRTSIRGDETEQGLDW